MKAARASTRPELSVVVPCYNEEAVLPGFARRITEVLESIHISHEVILVDDGSSDATARIATELCEQHSSFRLVSLLRNFGHQNAVSAGLDYTRGAGVVLIDADLQDPPEIIPEMVQKWREGYLVVCGQRRRREGETVFKRISAACFYRFMSWISQAPINRDTGDFRLMDRQVVDILRKMPERHRFIRGMVSWIGGPQTEVLYDRKPREAGESKYNLRKMVLFAADAITGFSVLPLRLATSLGAGTVCLSLLYAAVILAVRLFAPAYYEPGWPTVVILILFFGGMNLFCVGLVGEYVGRIFEESKGRPRYLVGNIYPPATRVITEIEQVSGHAGR